MASMYIKFMGTWYDRSTKARAQGRPRVLSSFRRTGRFLRGAEVKATAVHLQRRESVLGFGHP
ncbi:MAG TPA: hypothetical protein VEY30_05720 [Myxococcaceae bacterium]|nr:hypothetical protein [Myxococcaceae bacterium]